MVSEQRDRELDLHLAGRTGTSPGNTSASNIASTPTTQARNWLASVAEAATKARAIDIDN